MDFSLAKPDVTSFLCSQRTKLSTSKEQAPYRQHNTADSDMAATQPCHGIHHWLLTNTECVCAPVASRVRNNLTQVTIPVRLC